MSRRRVERVPLPLVRDSCEARQLESVCYQPTLTWWSDVVVEQDDVSAELAVLALSHDLLHSVDTCSWPK